MLVSRRIEVSAPYTLPVELLALDVRSEPFPVEHLTLYRSHLQRPAARYEPLERFPLGG